MICAPAAQNTGQFPLWYCDDAPHLRSEIHDYKHHDSNPVSNHEWADAPLTLLRHGSALTLDYFIERRVWSSQIRMRSRHSQKWNRVYIGVASLHSRAMLVRDIACNDLCCHLRVLHDICFLALQISRVPRLE